MKTYHCIICNGTKEFENEEAMAEETISQARPPRVKCNINGCEGWMSIT